MDEPKINNSIDLKGIQCPMTFQMTLLSLEGMASGENLEVIMDDGAGIVNVPRDIKDAGHKVLRIIPLDTKTFRLIIQKA